MPFKSYCRFSRCLAALLCFFYLWLSSYPAWADALSDAAGQGQVFGTGSVPMGIGGTTGSGAGSAIYINGPNGFSMDLSIEELFPGIADPVAADHDSLLENEDNIRESSDATISDLSTAATPTGEAFRAVFEGVNNSSRPDLRNDPIWGQTDTTLSDVFAGAFSDCTKTTTTISQTTTNYIHDYHSCERLMKSDACLVQRVVNQIEHTPQTECTPGEVLGKFNGRKSTFTYKCGDDGLSYVINNNFVIPNAFGNDYYVESGSADGCPIAWKQTCVDGAGGSRICTVSGGSINRYHPSLGGYVCDPEKKHEASNQTIQILNWTGETYETEEYYIETPQGCMSSGSFCQTDDASWACSDLDNTRVVNGITITPDVAQKSLNPLFPGDPQDPVCWKAQADRNCDFNVGQMECWTDPQGVEHCPYNSGDNINTCSDLEANPNCGFLRSACIDGARDTDGTCFAWEDTYDCQIAVPTTVAEIVESVECDGEIACMGGDCITHESQANDSFGKAAAVLQAAQFAMQDLDCTGSSGANCTVFKGEGMECKKALGGWQDCCESPVSIGLQDYIDLLMATNKIASAKTWLGMENPAYGSWTYVKDGAKSVYDSGAKAVSDVWASMRNTVTQAWETIAGTAGDLAVEKGIEAGASTATEAATGEVASTIIGKTIQELEAKIAQWVFETFGEVATDMLFSGAGSAASGTASQSIAANGGQAATGQVTLGGQIGAVLGPIMWAYTAYVIANLLVQIIWECEIEEFELAAKKDLKVCTKLGSYCADKVAGVCVEKREAYCCYQSPLSRIINEQARQQFAMGYGSLKNPNCSGLTIDQLGEVDWSLVDLSEWMAILQLTGHLADLNSEILNLEGLTGTGNVLMTGEDRPNVLERTIDRINGNDTLRDSREDLRQEMYLIQPPPPIQ